MAAQLTWVPFFAAFLSYSDRFSFRLKKNKYKNKFKVFFRCLQLAAPAACDSCTGSSAIKRRFAVSRGTVSRGKTRRYAVIRDSTAARLVSAPLGEEYEEHITTSRVFMCMFLAKLSETDPMRVAPRPFTGTLSSTDHDI